MHCKINTTKHYNKISLYLTNCKKLSVKLNNYKDKIKMTKMWKLKFKKQG